MTKVSQNKSQKETTKDRCSGRVGKLFVDSSKIVTDLPKKQHKTHFQGISQELAEALSDKEVKNNQLDDSFNEIRGTPILPKPTETSNDATESSVSEALLIPDLKIQLQNMNKLNMDSMQ